MPLHILSFLCQLHTPRSDRGRLAELVPAWLDQLREPPADASLTERQWRRWRLLHVYWQAHGPELLAHGIRRGLLQPPIEAELAALEPALTPPAQPRLIRAVADAPACTALFITAFPWGESHGECQALELRQVRYLDRFPPLHLSARVADVAILSAGNLALEALSHWLAGRLALAEDFPLWAEAAFPDTVRLVDESASLAFVAGTMQRILALEVPGCGFSGIVRRDSGRIETVQGFDLPYGKLEAAFDAGVRFLFLPRGTPLTALPQAGIVLQRLAEHHFAYYLADEPHDRLEIYLLQDLEDLFNAAFHARAPETVESRLADLPQVLGDPRAALPALAHWQSFQSQLEALLPADLRPALTRLGRAYQQACELSQAGLTPDWRAVAFSLTELLRLSVLLLAAVLASLALARSEEPQKPALLARLQGLQAGDIDGFVALLSDDLLLSGVEAVLQARIHSLTGFVSSVLSAPTHSDSALLASQLRYLIGQRLLEDLFIALSPDATGQLSYAGRRWPLPLLEIREGWRVFAGMEQEHPLYAELGTGASRPMPGACPYLPLKHLDLKRSLRPLHRQAGSRLFYGQEPIEVILTLRNSTYLSLPAVDCRQELPDGLSSADPLRWQGELAPLEERSFRYTLDSPPAGNHLLPAPQLSYRLPEIYRQEALRAEVPAPLELVIETHQTPVIEIQPQLPMQLMTGERLTLRWELSNTSPLPAEGLELTGDGVPPEVELLRPWLLPSRLDAYEKRLLEAEVVARLPAHTAWPALRLRYRGGQASAASLQAVVPPRPLRIDYRRELPPIGQSDALAWLDSQSRAPMLLLHGAKGLGKRQLLQSWLPQALSCELEGDAFLQLPYQALRRLLSQLLALPGPAHDALPGSEKTWLEDFIRRRLSSEDDEGQFKGRLFQTALQLIEALSLERPLRLKIYGVELLDRPSLEFLRFLLLNQARVQLVMTSPQASLPAQLADSPCAKKAIQRLDTAGIQAILNAHFVPHRLPAALANELRLRTQGMPLYLQEYLAALVEQNLITPRRGAWELSLAPAELPMPAALETLILEEFRSLPADLLSAAAVLGQDFDAADLAALMPDSAGGLMAFLTEARLRGLLVQGPEGYGFAHPLFRDLLYRQAGAACAPLHARAAAWFEARDADPQLAGRHWIQAGDSEKTLDYCLRLGEQALRQGSFEAAGDWLLKAEKLLRQRPQQQAARFRLYRWLGEFYRHTDHQDRAREAYRLYLRLAGEQNALLDQAWAWLGLGGLAQQSEALQLLDQGYSLACRGGDTALLCQACLQLGVYTAEARGYAEAKPWFEQALGHCPPASVKQAEVLETMGYEAVKAGQVQEAERILLQAKLVFESHQQLQGLASVYNRLGACCFYQQEWQRARHYFGESRKYCRQTGNQLKLAQVTHNLGLLAEALRDYPDAEALYQENLARAELLNDGRIQGFSWNQLASVHLKLRRCPEARHELARATELLELATDQRGMAYVRLNAGLLALLEADPLAAQAPLLAASASFDELGDVMGQDQAAMRLGHMAWLRGDLAAAESLYSRCLELRQTLDAKQEDGLERVYHALGLVAGARGEFERAAELLRQAELLLEKRREIPHYATACHNLMFLCQQRDQLDLALDYKQKRDVLIGIDRYGISRGLRDALGWQPILD